MERCCISDGCVHSKEVAAEQLKGYSLFFQKAVSEIICWSICTCKCKHTEWTLFLQLEHSSMYKKR